ncbi:heparan sulfate glucosamine 3-O-sulfotransferase 6-like [Patiria miniata]|uniref:Sulfotransferase domain-containing protein n=1 Tax=Patiria miniata TaxID=46514 RepID=A0A914AVQ3_PATMI|nr:heparan sulfate glucosamine 3-O-sulfotransferase 6-like [Patiria miniata]XP_038067843.1 heparan sulfate glucosamine 3-O-sulfotransferase 6-like [Patiria miniata]
MAVDKIPPGPGQACCSLRKKRVGILVAVCCVAILSTYMYSLNCCKSRTEAPPKLKTSNSPSFHKMPIFAKIKANTRMPEPSVNATQSVGIAAVKQTVFVHQLLQPQNPSPTNQDDLSSLSSWSSVYDEADDDLDLVPERAAFKPQGKWKRRLPKVIIIGIKKGGTQALLNFLKAHPEVTASGKEVHFFDRFYERDLEWYRRAMPYSYENQLTVEKTPSYFVTPQVPKLIYRMSQDVKFLLVVREPVARAISDHAQSLEKGKTTPFEEKAMLDPRKCSVDESWSAIGIGLYSVHLTRWLKYFPLDQFLFVSGKNLVANPGAEMGKVQDFLHISRTLTEKAFVFNETKGFPCLRTDENGEVRCLGKTKGRPHNPVDPRVRACLAEFYRPYNEQFYNMTGINFHWEE